MSPPHPGLRPVQPEDGCLPPARPESLSQQRLDARLQDGALDLVSAEPLTCFLAALEEHDRGAACHSEPRGGTTACLPQDAHESNLAGVPLGDRREPGGERLARLAVR